MASYGCTCVLFVWLDRFVSNGVLYFAHTSIKTCFKSVAEDGGCMSLSSLAGYTQAVG